MVGVAIVGTDVVVEALVRIAVLGAHVIGGDFVIEAGVGEGDVVAGNNRIIL